MFPEFVYDSFQYDVQSDGLHISFCFRLGDKIMFRPTAFFPCRPFLHPDRLSKSLLDRLVFNIGMIELVSYWKSYCSPKVIVKPCGLTADQISFWKKIYYNGLGEFFYTNGINAGYDDFMSIRCDVADAVVAPIGTGITDDCPSHSHIVPIGGGKDSVVTLELLKSSGATCIPLIMNPRRATRECVERAGYTMDDVIVIERKIDPVLLDLNSKGALNGHTPFSAMLAFYTLLASALTGRCPRIALSNENSANESTVSGSNINHQYSKSLEFENDFRNYVRSFITGDIDYYSFLRPLSELQIAMLFSRFHHYYDVFKSCNVGSKTDIWCGHCAKCLFAYIILSPFIPPQQLEAIFGKNMLDDITLRHEFDQLCGVAETKPFECVGTVSEVNTALSMTIARWYPGERPALLKEYTPGPVVTRLDSLFADHNVPADNLEALVSSLKNYKEDCIPVFYRINELFNILSGRSVLIAGYGREGQSSYKLLKSLFPAREFDIAHNNEEIASLLGKNRYDLILKSPGIPTAFFDGLCEPKSLTSQTDLFLQVYGDICVGITGTKGKSTTTSLVFSALQERGRGNVILAGNIGIPLFDIVPQLDTESVVVTEFSCHQLENIHRGPHIGILLNLFQEHLDHYPSYEAYKMAKMQIGLKQREGDMFIYCSDNDELSELVEIHQNEFRSDVVAYSLSEAKKLRFLDSAMDHLHGDHNLGNSLAAWLAVRPFGLTQESFSAMLSRFKGLEHRLEEVATKGGVTYYNDSISTIPQTTIAALEALKNVDTLILGGFSRGIDYSLLADYLSDGLYGKAVRNLVLFGKAGEEIHSLLKPSVTENRRIMSDFSANYSMESAVSFAAENTAKGKTCLLSPAASSYDHYKNFEERGRHFKQCVENMKD